MSIHHDQNSTLVFRVYWPLSCVYASELSLTSGTIIGWFNPQHNSCCVATVVQSIQQQTQACLQLLCNDQRLSSTWEHAQGTPRVLGCHQHNHARQPQKRDIDIHIHESSSSSNTFTLTIARHSVTGLPIIHEILLPHLNVHLYTSSSSSSSSSSSYSSAAGPSSPALPQLQIILYDPPRRGNLFTATPYPFKSAFSAEYTQQKSGQELTGMEGNGDSSNTPLTCVLKQINTGWKLLEEMQRAQRSLAQQEELQHVQTHMKHDHHTGNKHSYIDSLTSRRQAANNSKQTTGVSLPGPPLFNDAAAPPFCLRQHLLKLLLYPTYVCLLVLHSLASCLLLLLRFPLPSFFSYLSSYPIADSRPRLHNLSTLASQLSFRLLTITHWPALYQQSQTPPSPSADYHSSSLLFFSSITQLCVDVCAGHICQHLIQSFPSLILQTLHDFSHLFHSEVIRENVAWFQQQPVGLKLNPEINSRLGWLIFSALTLWDQLMSLLSPHALVLLIAISYTGWLGASVLLALCADVLSVLTAHVDLAHTLFSALFRLLLSLLSSLFRLFRGQKINVLRHRVDTLHYSMDQLLLGTALFAFIFFAFPTVLVYYAFFSFVRLLVTGAQAVMWWGMALFNCFPFFALSVWIFNRGALPGGIEIQTVKDSTLMADAVQPMEDVDDSVAENDASLFAMISEMRHDKQSVYTTRHHHRLHFLSASKRSFYVCSASYLQLVSCAVPCSSLFFPYRIALSYLQRHYNAKNLVRALITGKRLPTAPPASAALQSLITQ